MNKIAIVFPGQASQYVGMGKDLYESSAEIRKLYDLASHLIGEDIGKLSFEGPAEKIKETRYTQPAILLHSLAVLTILKEGLPKIDLTAGHSLGEYGSLALAGVLSFEDSIRAVVKRAALMEEACRNNPGTMAAIIGLEEEKIIEVCKNASAKGVVVPANLNSSNQIVISGSLAGIDEACRLCKEAGAKRAMVLPVGGAFHSPLMETAKSQMGAFLDTLTFSVPKVKIIPNVTGEPTGEVSDIKRLLVEQITSPVRWYQTMKYMSDSGVTTVIEVGPGKVLTGMAKREIEAAQMINLDTLADIESFNNILAG
jgi:[acyl-carrier-protein] S-malonyltransferase